MTRNGMISEMMSNWERSNNRNSKFYLADRDNYFSHISKLDIETLREKYENSVAFHSDRFEKSVNKEINRLDRAGMYNINNMKPQNMLD